MDAPEAGRGAWVAAQESFETGLRKTVQWYLANTAWVERCDQRGISEVDEEKLWGPGSGGWLDGDRTGGEGSR